MLNQFAKIALPLYQGQDSPYPLKEWVTLASIIEKEPVYRLLLLPAQANQP